MKLSHIGELALLEYIRNRFIGRSKDVVTGIGDDAAVLKAGGKQLLVTTDMMVEDIHFDLCFTTPCQLGFKIVSVNVSDIYAMGGTPTYLLLNMAMRKNTDMSFIESFFDGIQAALQLYKTNLIGGDISASLGDMSLCATCIGYGERVVNRSGAKVGDVIYVTGTLGDSACGLALLKKTRKSSLPLSSAVKVKDVKRIQLSEKITEPLINRHLIPFARNPKKFVRYATSMIDISDGLLIDLSRLCDESKVGARIFLDRIPLSPQLLKTASAIKLSPMHLALSGGEDYELLFTAPKNKKINAFPVGEIIESERVIVDLSGKEHPFSANGYQHFVHQRKETLRS